MSSLQKYYVLYYTLLVTILYNYHTYVPSACECVSFGYTWEKLYKNIYIKHIKIILQLTCTSPSSYQ